MGPSTSTPIRDHVGATDQLVVDLADTTVELETSAGAIVSAELAITTGVIQPKELVRACTYQAVQIRVYCRYPNL